MTDFKIGDLVRFANEQDGGPVHRIASVMSNGMVELHDFGGYFAPHLFVEAIDVAGIPPAADPYMEAARALNNAAYATIRACKDTTRYPMVNRHMLRQVAAMTDKLVDAGPDQTAGEEEQ